MDLHKIKVFFSLSFLAYSLVGSAISFEYQGFCSAGGGVTLFTEGTLSGYERMKDFAHDHSSSTRDYIDSISPSHRELSSRFNSHRDSKVGLIFRKALDGDFSFTTQILAKGYNSSFDFSSTQAFFKWDISHAWKARLGRFIMPVCLFSEHVDIGYRYPWVFLPTEVYSIISRPHINGIDVSLLGSEGSWHYRLTGIFGTADEPIVVDTTPLTMSTRNSFMVSGEIGGNDFKMKAVISASDGTSPLALKTIDHVVDDVGDIYSSWLINKFDADGENIIGGMDFDSWTQWLGLFIDNEISQKLGPDTWSSIKDEFDNNVNTTFLQSAATIGFASLTNNDSYVNIDGLSDDLLSAYRAYTSGEEETLTALTSLGSSEVSDLTDLKSALALADLTVFQEGFSVDNNAVTEGLTNIISLDLSADVPSAIDLVLGGNIEAREQFLAGYFSQNSFQDKTVEETAQAIMGSLVALGFEENSDRFSGMATLLSLINEDVSGNYEILQDAIKDIIDQTYLVELQEYLRNTFGQTWCVRGFSNIGYVYDNRYWFSAAEYVYGKKPGYLGDAQSWYVTLGKRFDTVMPFVTYGSSSIKNIDVQSITSVLSHSENQWNKMFDNIQNDEAAISDITYENIMYTLSSFEDFWNYNQFHSQDSITLGLRYDWQPNVCFKIQLQHVRPKIGSGGIFEPRKILNKVKSNTLHLSIDAVL